MTSLLDRAIEYHQLGFTILRVGPNKRPVGYYKRFRDHRPTLSHIMAWYDPPGNDTTGIALMLGAPSNGLIALDFDGPDWEWAYDVFVTRFPRLAQSRTIRTASGKRHVWLQTDPESLDFTREEYSWRPVRDFTVELRGNGVLLIAPPSRIDISDNGNELGLHGTYKFESSETPIVEIDAHALRDFRKSLDEVLRRPPIAIKRVVDFFSLDNIIPPGSQNDEAFYTAVQLRDHDYTENDTLTLLTEVLTCQEQSREPWTEESIDEHIVRNVYSREIRGPATLTDDLSLSDDGDRHLFYKLFGEKYRYRIEDRTWLSWDGLHWDASRGDGDFWWDLSSLHRERFDQVGALGLPEEDRKPWYSRIARLQSYPTMSNIQALLKADRRLSRYAREFDTYPHLLSVGNGILDLSESPVKLIAPDPDLMITHSVQTEYHTDATCPLWETFLDRIFRETPEVISYVQAAIGYSLTGDMSEHVFFVLHGTGRNGKGVLTDTIQNLLSGYASHPNIDTFIRQDYAGSIRDDIARLAGKRFVSTGEPSEGRQLDSGILKALTGEDVQTARQLYSNLVSFTPQMTIWISVNTLPRVSDLSSGFWDRIKVIPFPEMIPLEERNTRLRSDLMDEFEGILTWAVQGWEMWKESLPRGLRSLEPKVIRNATHSFSQEDDPIGTFVDEFYEVALDPSRADFEKWRVDVNTFVAHFQIWASDPTITKTKISRTLSGRGIKVHSHSSVRSYRGIRPKKERND